MDSFKKYIEDFVKNFDTYIYPDSLSPVYQILMAFISGLFFGAYHYAFLWTFISYSIFEYIFCICAYNRPQIYNFRTRAVAILMAIAGILFSKFIWGFYNPPMFRFFPY